MKQKALVPKLVLVSGLVLGWWLGMPGIGLAQDNPDAVYWDWPVGQCLDGDFRFVPGYGFTLQQDYGHQNNPVNTKRCGSDNPNCMHAGLDIFKSPLPGSDNGRDATNAPVFAVADGRVVALLDWGGMTGQGNGVLVRHDVPAGADPVYAQYLHLDKVWVGQGQRIRRGQPVGTVGTFPGDTADHLHFEVRPELRVRHCPEGVTTCRGDSLTTSCRGNGYGFLDLSSGELASIRTELADWGFEDPIDALFEADRRAPSPTQVVADRAATVYAATDDTSENRGIYPVDTLATAGEPSTVEDATDGLGVKEVWYPLSFQQGDTTVEGLVRSYDFNDNLVDIVIGEVPRTGRQWVPPTESPVIDLRFTCLGTDEECRLANGTEIRNFAPDAANGVLLGELGNTVPYAVLSELVDSERFCDPVGDFPGSADVSIEFDTAEEVNFRGGVDLELSVRLDSNADQLLAARGEEDSESWKLAVENGELTFTIRHANGNTASVVHPLPAPECRTGEIDLECTCTGSGGEDDCDDPDNAIGNDHPLFPATTSIDCTSVPANCPDPTAVTPGCVADYGYRQWRHVAAVAEFDPEEGGEIRLYWDGVEVDSEEISRQLVDDGGPVRVGEGLNGLLDDLIVWATPAEEEVVARVDSVLIVDSSGSMLTFDPSDQRKNAGLVYLDIVPEDDRIGLVDFDEDVESIALQPISDADGKMDLEDFIDDVIDSSGLTNITAGVQEACDLLNPVKDDDTLKLAVLLTDGISDFSDSAKVCFLQDGWFLYALGFGGADDGLLERIVRGTGGTAQILPQPEDALCALQQVRAEIVGGADTIPCQDVVIGPREAVDVDVAVGPQHDYLNLFSAWPGSDVEMTLISPSGRIIDRRRQGPDVVHRLGSTFELFRVNGPEPGLWRMELFGADVAREGERVVFGGNLFAAVALPRDENGPGGGDGPDVSNAVADPTELWPPNHRFRDVEIAGVTDTDGGPVEIEILGITQDEPVPSHATAPDAEGVGTPVASLRAERLGEGDGRVYEITFVARGDGGETVGTVTVCVPHDRSGDECTDSGQSFDSTVP